MLKLLAENKLKKKILPGSNMKSTIPKSEHLFDSYSYRSQSAHIDGRNYVNNNLEENENEDYIEMSRKALPNSNMSSVDSLTNYSPSMVDLKDLNLDEQKLCDNYVYKDPSDISNCFEISKHKSQIVQMINSSCVVLISGPTGCGKSTQVPQFILDDCMNRKKFCNIVVTQPRRIAAISVCKQVNNERKWRNGLLVGYQVGRKKDYDPNTTKVLFCTTGILLQKIISAKNLSDFTHIILDEVHERTLEMDFLLLIIKKLLKTNSPSTRVILMSATAQDFKLCDYFSDYYGAPYNCYVRAQQISITKNPQFNVSLHYLDELYGLIPSARAMEFDRPQITKTGYDTAIHLIKGFDDLDKCSNVKASVLIFLPGIFEIEEMHRFMEYTMASENFKWKLLPLHSSITSEEQDRVFEQPSVNYRKIILATNIAESSITVPDVSYVVDFCLMKQLHNELKSNYSMLVLNWASKSNCIQRSGRVGRVADGRVYRLVPEQMFVDDFVKEELPEMSRCSLSRIVLMSKILDMGSPKLLLSGAMDPPNLKNIVLTITTLKQVGALLPTVNGAISFMDGDITFMGKVMAQLPLDPPMSKLIYFGYIFNVFNEAIIMACGLSIKSIFSQPFNKRLDAYTQKLSWANFSCSDPIAFIAPYEIWLQHKPEFDRNHYDETRWAQKNYIQLSAIRELHDLIDDVVFRLKHNLNILPNSSNIQWVNLEEKSMACKVILAGAFYPNYFIRGKSTAAMDDHELHKLLDNHDPNQTVYFSGFPSDQPKELYKEAIENLFPHNLVGKPTAHFGHSNKIFIKFPVSNTVNTNTYNSNYNENNGKKLIPGNICFGVYVALKMHQLRFEFNIPLLKPLDAKRRVELIFKQMAAQNMSIQKITPIQKSIEQVNTKTPITLQYYMQIDRVKGSNTIKDSSVISNALNLESNNVCLNIKSPTYDESDKQYCLKGPFSPLKISIHGISRSNHNKAVKIESQSVNSVLLDTNPNDYHERLFVAGKVCMNENEKLTLWDSTVMPNIPGMPAIICLLFSPCVEIRYNSSYTKMTGALCGLGYDPDTLRPLFEDNDIELTFDIAMDHNLLNKINVLRLLLNKCVNPEDKEGPGDIFQIQHSLQTSLIEILSIPVKFKIPETAPRKYRWGIIPKSRLQSPYQEDSPINNPMAGSDVYKLLWGVVLSPFMSSVECKELLHNLCRIKRLEEIFRTNYYCSEPCVEELFCPLCHLTFSSNSSMQMHFNNYQHKERYKTCKEELEFFYKGPSTDIEHL